MKKFITAVLLIIVIGGLAGGGYYYNQRYMNLKLSVFFEDLKSVEKGNPVILNGKEIGFVKKSELLPARESGKNWKVELSIKDYYMTHLKKNSLFYIDEHEGEKAVLVDTCGDHKAPALSWGDSVEGVDSLLTWKFGCVARDGYNMATDLLKDAEKALSDVSGSLKDVENSISEIANSPEGQKIQKDFGELYEAIGELGEASGEKLVKEIPALTKDINALAKELRKSGHEEDAKKLEKKARKLEKKAENYEENK
jgi:MlaD protein